MKKNDLKFGMVVELKNGSLCLVEPIYGCNGSSVKGYLIDEPERTVQFRNLKTAEWETTLLAYNSNLINDSDGHSIIKIYEDYTLKNLLWKRKEVLLTNEEKEWLAAVIKPFRDKVECINLDKPWNGKKAGYINIKLHNNDSLFTPSFNSLPFKFEGLEFKKDYTLEELGL